MGFCSDSVSSIQSEYGSGVFSSSSGLSFVLQTDSAEGMGVETELEEATMLSLGTAVDAL